MELSVEAEPRRACHCPLRGDYPGRRGDADRMEPKPWPDATMFNSWYADMAGSSVKDEIVQRHLGLPPALLSSSLLDWEGMGEVTEALRLSDGSTLLDLACGRGGAALIGVDFSSEAVSQAREHAERLGRIAEFRVGDLAATGLQSGSVDAVVCVDAIQFARQPDAAYRELLRVLALAGRVALTSWEAVDKDDERLSERVRLVALRDGLSTAGFADVQVADRPAWGVRERSM